MITFCFPSDFVCLFRSNEKTIMGNFWSNWFDNQPDNDGDDERLEQPRWFGHLPHPNSIDTIEPTLTLFDRNGTNIEINHKQQMNMVIDIIRKSGCFDQSNDDDDDGGQRLVIITHGFRSDKHTEWLHECKDAILDFDHSNSVQQWQVVGILGWGGGADIGLVKYQQAASNCFEVGKWLGNFLRKFRQEFPNVFTYGIGHSLGAHLLGMAGRKNTGNFDRITGLDPAGPGFQNENHDKRLNNMDAWMVDVIHTDGQDIPYFGTLVPLGKIDFYPNYGWNQPSTDERANVKPMMARNPRNNSKKFVKSNSPYGYNMSESHSRAIEFFRWSIENPGKFRTYLQLEQAPDVEIGVHRIRSIQPMIDVEVEMGYHLDTFLQMHINSRCSAVNNKNNNQKKLNPDNDDKQSREELSTWKTSTTNNRKYWGNYYVHTNAQSPWC